MILQSLGGNHVRWQRTQPAMTKTSCEENHYTLHGTSIQWHTVKTRFLVYYPWPCHPLAATNEENWPLVSEELVEFEKWLVEAQDFRKLIDPFRRNLWNMLQIHKGNQKITTCNSLDLETLEHSTSPSCSVFSVQGVKWFHILCHCRSWRRD